MTRHPEQDARRLLDDALAASTRPAITCSFQPGGLAVLHLLGERRRAIPVLFIDTGYHFQATLEFKELVTTLWGLDVRTIRGRGSAQAHMDHLGPLHRTNPDLCCADRKTGPLFAALEEHDLWITGLRRDQAATRRSVQIAERRVLLGGQVVSKLNPIADWTARELEAYTMIHEIPVHPLLDEGYPSIGCAPCTERAPVESRAGRWAGRKVECGLHTGLEAAAVDA